MNRLPRHHSMPLAERWQLFEGSLCHVANRWGRGRRIRPLMTAVSRAGDGPAWYVLMASLILVDGVRGLTATIHMAATGLSALLLYLAIKHRTKRARPFHALPGICALTPALDQYSFPSGHTLHAVAFTAVAVSWYPLLAWVLLPFCGLVALSRVVLGLHYPTDVLASVALASLLSGFSLSLFAAG